MRLVLSILAVTLCASAAAAQPIEDRYGPRRAEPVRVMASNAAAYQGRMLTWSSRAFVPQVPEPSSVATVPAPTPVPVVAAPTPRAQPAPIAVSAGPQAAPARPAAPATPRPPVQAAALPDSLYSPPPPTAAPSQRMAAAARPATPSALGSQPRLYSVHRQYGMAPDAIPAAPAAGANYVLIAPREGVGGDEGKSRDEDDRPF